jgi:hypothetical protein
MSNTLKIIKMEFNKELINDIIGRDFNNTLDNMWVIMVENKIFCPTGTAMFHYTREQAWKHFYNEFNWRVKNKYKSTKYGDDWWKLRKTIPETDTQIWNAFKNELFNNYDFRIIQWKDAKRELSERDKSESL